MKLWTAVKARKMLENIIEAIYQLLISTELCSINSISAFFKYFLARKLTSKFMIYFEDEYEATAISKSIKVISDLKIALKELITINKDDVTCQIMLIYPFHKWRF